MAGTRSRSPSPLLLAPALLLAVGGEPAQGEELARAAADAPGGYLAPGDRVRARIDGLGTQIIRIAEPGTPLAPDPCGQPREAQQP